MKVLNFYSRGYLLQIHDLSNLPNLEELLIQKCWGSFASDKSVSFLSNLKILRIKYCEGIKSIPPLDCPSLVELDLSGCSGLESFPLMVNGFAKNLKILRLERCSKIRIIPLNMLHSLEELNLNDCTNIESFSQVVGEGEKPNTMSVDFPNRVAAVSMLAESTIEGEGNVTPMKSSHVEYICLRNRKLSDEYLSISFMLFANVKELHLAKTLITVLPKSMEKCKFLWRLILDDCVELQEIKGIPPRLKVFSALNCQLLTSSSKSKLLNQVMIYFVFICNVIDILLDIV
jgi:Leucine-rich repeat (LRR) protein